jgi:flagellar biosynthetic protein FlhB
MANQDDRSEKPTQRRIEKAREEGRVVSSRQFAIAFNLLAVYLFAFQTPGAPARALLERWTQAFREVFVEQAPLAAINQAASIVQSGILPWFAALAALTAGSSLAAQLAMSGGAVRIGALAPDPKKLFAFRKLYEGYTQAHTRVFAVAAAAAVAIVLSVYPSWRSAPELEALRRSPVAAQIARYAEPFSSGARLTLCLFLVLGAAELFRQWRKLSGELKMTKKEVKDESKESNGNPLIKAALKRRMKALLSNRMMQKVPEATVLIVNPTHFAVALAYDPETSDAPMVTAKGLDYLALRMRRKAEECGVPVVENPPLAQAIYKSAEVGHKIPVELYRAVAEVLAYVFRVLGRRSAR